MMLPQFKGLWQTPAGFELRRASRRPPGQPRNFAVAIASPSFTVYMLRDLHFTDLEYTASTGISVLAQFLTLNMRAVA